MTAHYELRLPEYPMGFHLITDQIVSAIEEWPQNGLLHVFIKHTSAGLTINENADPTVREDFDAFIKKLVPENEPYFKHIFEGPDDMPAHIKSSLMGSSVSIPIVDGHLGLGTWQGIYLCEFRNHGGRRKLLVSLSS